MDGERDRKRERKHCGMSVCEMDRNRDRKEELKEFNQEGERMMQRCVHPAIALGSVCMCEGKKEKERVSWTSDGPSERLKEVKAFSS